MSFLALPWRLTLLSLDKNTVQRGQAGTAADDRYRAEGQLGTVVTWHGNSRMMSSPVTVLVAQCR